MLLIYYTGRSIKFADKLKDIFYMYVVLKLWILKKGKVKFIT